MSTYRKALGTFIFLLQLVIEVYLYNAIRNYDGMNEAWIGFNVALFIVNTVIAIIHISYTLDRA